MTDVLDLMCLLPASIIVMAIHDYCKRREAEDRPLIELSKRATRALAEAKAERAKK